MTLLHIAANYLAWFVTLFSVEITPQPHVQKRPYLKAEMDFSGKPVKLAQNLIKLNYGDELDMWLAQCDTGLSGDGKINIMHLGDSHIQADHMSGRMRELLQFSFGNGGRGLVFPYRAAGKTNTPDNYKLQVGGEWKGCKNVSYFKICDIGANGIMVYTYDTSAYFYINPNTNPWLNYSFNYVKLFTKNTAGQFDYFIRKDSVTVVRAQVAKRDSFFTELSFNEYQPVFGLSLGRKDTLQREFNFFGASLENDTPGVLYHMAGINGAEYFSFLRCNLLGLQLRHLNPHLVIISLGTNEGFNPYYNDEDFKINASLLIDRIREAKPGVSILLTMPGESLQKRKYPVKRLASVRKVLYEIAAEKHCAVWDLYEVMGGLGSMKRWHAHSLTAKDLIHYNAAGYRLQGELLYTALLKYYTQKRGN